MPMTATRESSSTDTPSRLFVRWQQDGDRRAQEQLVTRYMPLVRKLARKYHGADEPIEDLIQVASLGLVKAIDRFDTTRGLAFTSFAVPTILGELRRYFRDTGWGVHVPRSAKERALQVRKVAREITDETGRSPSVQQIAQLLEWPIEQVLDALEAGNGHHSSSLNAPSAAGDEDSEELLDRVPSVEEGYETVDTRLALASAISHLPPTTREAVRLRFVEDLTQAEIGERLGVSQMQISRLLRSALTDVKARI